MRGITGNQFRNDLLRHAQLRRYLFLRLPFLFQCEAALFLMPISASVGNAIVPFDSVAAAPKFLSISLRS